MHKVYTNVMKKVSKDVALQFDLKTCSFGMDFSCVFVVCIPENVKVFLINVWIWNIC